MTEDLRALMRAELSEERPPPLGDLVATAMRDGRRITRRRRFAMVGASAAVLAVAVGGAAVAWPAGGGRQLDSPAAVGSGSSAPPSVSATPEPTPSGSAVPRRFPSDEPEASTGTGARPTPMTVRLQGQHVRTKQLPATPESVLELLTRLLPKGKVSKLAANAEDGLFAQVYLDTGKGPGMLRVWLKPYDDPDLKPGTVVIETFTTPDNCVQSTVVNASYSTGGHVEMNIATCLGSDREPAPAPITVDEAVKVLSDARWGVRMDAELVAEGAKHYAGIPASAR
ncbi:hypothetical protein [Actinoplanes sp. N902-109]|uniref:hypothetical protein n=1 Tax=Actinoplanes sp. (strain N902-109) TaxID=649831 RepID=UPI00032967DD|nr:hypothetical protein [Actinoplanes sp. N902-109]AGL17214.1 hypothetical protein L083_3704 [Actinoplanes sp. N902-109]